MKYGLLILLLITTVIQAQVYRTTDKNGNVIFTDVADDNAEEVVIDIAPSYTPIPVTAPVIDDADPEVEILVDMEAPNYKISIVSPEQNQSIHNPEVVSVVASVSPELHGLRSDKLLFKLDGKDIGEAQESMTVNLSGLERGSHILTVSVIDKTGAVLKRSKSVLFHVHRRSVAQ